MENKMVLLSERDYRLKCFRRNNIGQSSFIFFDIQNMSADREFIETFVTIAAAMVV